MSAASLSGKTVLVTGAARGIGEHVARQAAAGGDQVGRLESEAGALRRSFGAHVTDEAGAFDEHQRDGVQR